MRLSVSSTVNDDQSLRPSGGGSGGRRKGGWRFDEVDDEDTGFQVVAVAFVKVHRGRRPPGSCVQRCGGARTHETAI